MEVNSFLPLSLPHVWATPSRPRTQTLPRRIHFSGLQARTPTFSLVSSKVDTQPASKIQRDDIFTLQGEWKPICRRDTRLPAHTKLMFKFFDVEFWRSNSVGSGMIHKNCQAKHKIPYTCGGTVINRFSAGWSSSPAQRFSRPGRSCVLSLPSGAVTRQTGSDPLPGTQLCALWSPGSPPLASAAAGWCPDRDAHSWVVESAPDSRPHQGRAAGQGSIEWLVCFSKSSVPPGLSERILQPPS